MEELCRPSGSQECSLADDSRAAHTAGGHGETRPARAEGESPSTGHPVLIFLILQGSEAETITPAQFDWNKSGLTNPLSENGNYFIS